MYRKRNFQDQNLQKLQLRKRIRSLATKPMASGHLSAAFYTRELRRMSRNQGYAFFRVNLFESIITSRPERSDFKRRSNAEVKISAKCNWAGWMKNWNNNHTRTLPMVAAMLTHMSSRLNYPRASHTPNPTALRYYIHSVTTCFL